jgi:hypothetical protein
MHKITIVYKWALSQLSCFGKQVCFVAYKYAQWRLKIISSIQSIRLKEWLDEHHHGTMAVYSRVNVGLTQVGSCRVVHIFADFMILFSILGWYRQN